MDATRYALSTCIPSSCRPLSVEYEKIDKRRLFSTRHQIAEKKLEMSSTQDLHEVLELFEGAVLRHLQILIDPFLAESDWCARRGDYGETAFETCEAAAACVRHGQSLRATRPEQLQQSLEKAASYYFDLALVRKAAGQLWPALEASRCCLELAAQAECPLYFLRSVVLYDDFHCDVVQQEIRRPLPHEEVSSAVDDVEQCIGIGSTERDGRHP